MTPRVSNSVRGTGARQMVPVLTTEPVTCTASASTFVSVRNSDSVADKLTTPVSSSPGNGDNGGIVAENDAKASAAGRAAGRAAATQLEGECSERARRTTQRTWKASAR
jgi:hypothetical protein